MLTEAPYSPRIVIWTFAGCLAIYLIATGIVAVAGPALEFVYRTIDGGSFMGGFVNLLRSSVKLIVGLVLMSMAKKEVGL